MEALFEEDRSMAVWWATPVEAVSAIVRCERLAALDPRGLMQARMRLDSLGAEWEEVLPSEQVRDAAVRLIRVHELRAADSLQLAAAIAASEEERSSLPLVTLDRRLSDAARREGFTVVDLS